MVLLFRKLLMLILKISMIRMMCFASWFQLELYFGKVLGRTPLQQSDRGGFYPDVFEYARTKDYGGMSEGQIQMDFVYNCCVAAQPYEDLRHQLLHRRTLRGALQNGLFL